jgi:hypothetical protein
MPSNTIFSMVVSLLMTVNTPLALFCFVMAGLQLRGEGGINFDANGGFFRWMIWGAIFLTLAQIFAWLAAEGFTAASGGLSATTSSAYTVLIQNAVSDFVYNVVRDRVVPIIAGALVLKALLDTAEGHSPIPSVISALFLLGVGGFFTTAQGWNDGSTYATVDLLKSILTWAMTSVSPMMGIMCIYGAILQFVRKQNWSTLLFVGMAFLSVTAIWSLIQSWAGVTVL